MDGAGGRGWRAAAGARRTSGVWHDESSSCIQPRDWPSDASDCAFHADVPLYATQCVGRSAWR